MRKQFVIGVLVLLLVKVPNIQSGCRWDDSSQKDCSINCVSQTTWPLDRESTAKIMPILLKAYAEVKHFIFIKIVKVINENL